MKKKWRWTEIKFRGIPLDVCVYCEAKIYTGNDICLVHSEEVITPLFNARTKMAIYKAAIKKIKQKELDDGSTETIKGRRIKAKGENKSPEKAGLISGGTTQSEPF